MTTFAFPSGISPSNMTWSLRSNTQVFTSPTTGVSQTAEAPGAAWSVQMVFRPLTEDDARTLIAFLVGLRGMANRLTLHDHSLTAPRGIATGTPLVKGAAQTGGTINTDGWTINATGILKAGDWVGIGGELKMIRADVNSDASGNAALLVEPPQRSSPADNSAIITASPTAAFMLADDGQAGWNVTAARSYGLTVNAVEALT